MSREAKKKKPTSRQQARDRGEILWGKSQSLGSVFIEYTELTKIGKVKANFDLYRVLLEDGNIVNLNIHEDEISKYTDYLDKKGSDDGK